MLDIYLYFFGPKGVFFFLVACPAGREHVEMRQSAKQKGKLKCSGPFVAQVSGGTTISFRQVISDPIACENLWLDKGRMKEAVIQHINGIGKRTTTLSGGLKIKLPFNFAEITVWVRNQLGHPVVYTRK